jgi:hypothetical protein
MRYRIVIEGEATDPPPDYPATLRKVVQQETKFMLGKAWDVVECMELVSEHPATASGPEVTVWKSLGDAVQSVPGTEFQWGSQVGRVSGLDPDA